MREKVTPCQKIKKSLGTNVRERNLERPTYDPPTTWTIQLYSLHNTCLTKIRNELCPSHLLLTLPPYFLLLLFLFHFYHNPTLSSWVSLPWTSITYTTNFSFPCPKALGRDVPTMNGLLLLPLTHHSLSTPFLFFHFFFSLFMFVTVLSRV